MKKMARCILPMLAALFLVPSGWATERVVDLDGTIYSVDVVPVRGRPTSRATALSYSILRPGGTVEAGTIPSTRDSSGDREPNLVLSPGIGGPFLVWTRNDGFHDQIAYSHFERNAWSQPRYLTSGARDHTSPRVGVDRHGTATLVWIEPAGQGEVMVGIFDPANGNLLSTPKNVISELARSSAPERLGGNPTPQTINRTPVGYGNWPLPNGGNDTPAIPPCTPIHGLNCRNFSGPNGSVAVGPSCDQAAVGVVNNDVLSIGLLDGGVVVKHYQASIPAGAPPEYVSMLLRRILDEHCH